MSIPEIDNKILTYSISQRSGLPGKDLGTFALEAAKAGIDYFQIREKDLSDRALYHLTKEIVETTKGQRMKILVNDRMDIALAAGAHGVQAGIKSAPVAEIRKAGGKDFIIGYSSHSIDEAVRVAEQGATFITFSPIFPTLSKKLVGPAQGISKLEEVVRNIKIPVFALGGIEEANLAELVKIRIAGVAAITLFQRSNSLPQLVRKINSRSFE